ncbi:MAG: signal peptidase I, partial [Acidipropionibacterium jensenii]|nr:signal peptidase I [Acidipropionibacterium jensenii]
MSSEAKESSNTAQQAPMWRRWLGSFWGELLFAVVVVGLVLSFVAKPYQVPSASMEQTLQPGDRILVNRLAYRFGQPKAGDVVVFNAGQAWRSTSGSTDGSSVRGAIKTVLGWTGFGPTGSHTLVKRIIAVGGEKVSCCSTNGSIVVEGRALNEPYLGSNFPFTPGKLDCGTTPRSFRCFAPVTVPENSYLMLGDNRADSS